MAESKTAGRRVWWIVAIALALVAAIVLGVLFGLYSMFSFLLKTMDHIGTVDGRKCVIYRVNEKNSPIL